MIIVFREINYHHLNSHIKSKLNFNVSRKNKKKEEFKIHIIVYYNLKW